MVSLGMPKDVMLNYAHNIYQPGFFDGDVYYFRAVRDKMKQTSSPHLWAKMVKNLHLIDMPCRHNDIPGPENSKVLVKKLCSIMENRDA
jgi:hypothetical protein